MLRVTPWLHFKAEIWDVLRSSAVLCDRLVLLSHLIPPRGEAESHKRSRLKHQQQSLNTWSSTNGQNHQPSW